MTIKEQKLEIGKRIAELRKERGVTNSQIKSKGIHGRMIPIIERGKSCPGESYGFCMLLKYLDACGLTLKEVVNYEPSEPKPMKHKLAGFAIKGDGTTETADRIKKVFVADGWINKAKHKFDTEYYYTAVDGEVFWIRLGLEHYTILPLSEAEALVFGGLKAVSE